MAVPRELKTFRGAVVAEDGADGFTEMGDRAPHVVEMAIDTLHGFAWTVGVTAAGTRGGIGGGDGH